MSPHLREGVVKYRKLTAPEGRGSERLSKHQLGTGLRDYFRNSTNMAARVAPSNGEGR